MNTENIAMIVESVTGSDPLRAGRSRPVVEARVLLASVLLAKGYTEHQTGDALGFDHATIHHYKTLLDDARRYGNNPQMLRNWNKLKQILDL